VEQEEERLRPARNQKKCFQGLFSTDQKRGRGFEPPQLFGLQQNLIVKTPENAGRRQKTPEDAGKRRKTPGYSDKN